MRKPIQAASTRRLTDRPGNVARPAVYQLPETNPEPVIDVPHTRDAKMARVEALFFIAEEPLTLRRIVDCAGLQNTKDAETILNCLREYYDADESSFQIADIAEGYQLLTRAAYYQRLSRVRPHTQELRLTATTLETLTAIAYKQPITKADIEAIRGVNPTEQLRILSEKGLIRVVGRDTSLGRPQLYGTTKQFLQAFGLHTLTELPHIESLTPPST